MVMQHDDEGCGKEVKKGKAVFQEIAHLRTEMNNPATANLDMLQAPEIMQRISAQFHDAVEGVEKLIQAMQPVLKEFASTLKRGGRIVYIGAGASGRVGFAEAVEMTPTFSVAPWRFVALIAGGPVATPGAAESAEDRDWQGAWDLRSINLTRNDMVIGLSASGRTPYVLGGLKYAHETGCTTVLISTNPEGYGIHHQLDYIDHKLCPDIGPEIIVGSTRMKSAIAQNIILQTLSTTAMVMMGRTYGNLMVEVCAVTEKLKERAKKIIMLLTDLDYDQASELLERAGGSAKIAVVMHRKGVDRQTARAMIAEAEGFIRKVIDQ